MRIVMLTYWGDKGGVYMHVMNIAERVSKLPDVELHIVALSADSRKHELFGCTTHFLKRVRGRGANYFYNPRLIKNKILEINPDLVHIHTTFASHAIASLMLPKKYPTIVTVHQCIKSDIKSRLHPSIRQHIKLIIDPYLEKRLLEKAEHIVVPSPHLEEYYSALKNKISVIPNGVNLEEIRNSSWVNENLMHPSILFMGRLERIKGVDTLIRSIQLVVCLIPDVHLYIAGSGEEEGELKHLVRKLDIVENVTFLGFISGDVKWSCYKSADLFVLPSLDDNAPVALPEAMACGKPVIASNVGGIPCVVEDDVTGLLFECGDVKDLAEKIVILLQNSELRGKMGRTGQERAKEFSWDGIAKRTMKLYETIYSTFQSNIVII